MKLKLTTKTTLIVVVVDPKQKKQQNHTNKLNDEYKINCVTLYLTPRMDRIRSDRNDFLVETLFSVLISDRAEFSIIAIF